MDQKEDLISQHDTLKSVRRSYSSKQAYIRGETYLVAYAKYRLEYYQTLINPKTKEVRTLTWISKKNQSNDNTFSRLRTNKITLMKAAVPT
jgi:hypothetical protein